MEVNKLLLQAIEAQPRAILYMSAAYKTYEYFLAQVNGLVRGVYAGYVGGEFIDTMANLISGQLTQAYQQAYADEGYTEYFLPEWLQTPLTEQIANQYMFVDKFFRDIIDARFDATPIDPLLVRAEQWANQWNAAYREAIRIIRTQGGGNLEWVQGQTEHGCATCSFLDGLVMSANEWELLGLHPRGYPNPKLDCEGGGPANYCDCDLKPTDKRRSPNAYGRIEEMLLTRA